MWLGVEMISSECVQTSQGENSACPLHGGLYIYTLYIYTTNYVFIFYCLLQGVMAIEIFKIKLALLTTFMFILNSFTLFLGLFY